VRQHPLLVQEIREPVEHISPLVVEPRGLGQQRRAPLAFLDPGVRFPQHGVQPPHVLVQALQFLVERSDGFRDFVAGSGFQAFRERCISEETGEHVGETVQA